MNGKQGAELLPNVFIPGARKSATTSLYRILDQHPEIGFGKTKEPHFFSKNEMYAELSKQCCTNFEQEGNKLRIDGSQSYLPLQYVHSRILETVGEKALFIVVLRDPIDRAMSAYAHEAKHVGREKRKSAELVPRQIEKMSLTEFLDFEKEAIHKGFETGQLRPRRNEWSECYFPYNYFGQSAYSTFLQHLEGLFSRESILYLTFEQVIKQPGETFNACCQFLELGKVELELKTVHENKSMEYKSRVFQRLIRPFRNKVPKLLPNFIRRQLGSLERFFFKKPIKARLSPDVERILRQMYKPEIEKVEEITQLDLSSWKDRQVL